MTTLENRLATALLVVDMQNGVIASAHARALVVANVGILVEKARRDRIPVIWVQHFDKQLTRGSDEWRIVPEFSPRDTEPLVEKTYGDAFEDTNLANVLLTLRVGRLFVVGAETDACIRSTLHGALVRGYDVTLVSDAHTTNDQTSWARLSLTRTCTGLTRWLQGGRQVRSRRKAPTSAARAEATGLLRLRLADFQWPTIALPVAVLGPN